MAKLIQNDHENDNIGQMLPMQSVNDDGYDERGRNIDARRQRDYSRAQSVPPPSKRHLPRNSYGELESQSRFGDQDDLHPTASNTRGDELPSSCRPCYPQGYPPAERDGIGQRGVPQRSFVPGNTPPSFHPPPQRGSLPPWWNDEMHQLETHHFAALPPPSDQPPWWAAPDSAFVTRTSPRGSPIEQGSIAGQKTAET